MKRNSKNIIPGCTYMTKNGIELLYVGYGDFWLDNGTGKPTSNPYSIYIDKYLYFRVKDLERFFKNGEMTRDLSLFYGNGHIEQWLSIREKSRSFVHDIPVRKMFEPEFFQNYTIVDNSYGGVGEATWHFTAK